MQRKRTAAKRGISLALGGGGARGFAHIGLLEELDAAQIPIAEIAGTSMGAIIGAYYAVHGDIEQPRKLADRMTRKLMLSLLDPVLPKEGLIEGKKLRHLLEKWFGNARIEEARIPLAITATNLRTGKAEIFREGPLVPILLASAAIPGLLPAVKLGEEYYIDGGLAAQVPHQALRKRGVHVLVELPLNKEERPPFTKQPSIIDVLTLAYAFGREKGQQAPSKACITLRPAVGSFEFTLHFLKARGFVQAGRSAARSGLARIKRRLRAPCAARSRTRHSGES